MAKIRDTAIVLAAKAAHEANRVYCSAIGDDTQVPWEHAPDWQRRSSAAGVKLVLDNPGTSASALHEVQLLHEAWLEQKRKDGWVYGEKKDAEKKTHPCMVPYDELPPAQRAKDSIFDAVVRGVLAHHKLL